MTRTPDQDIAACRAFALQLREYTVSRVLNDAADQIAHLALAAATGTAKTPTAAECEASQSGPKGNARNA